MKIFVAGASGVIGRPLLGLLIGAGHDVSAMTRSPNQKARRELGWTPRYPTWRQGFRETLG